MARRVVLNVTPDRLDLRDRPYLPAVALAPPAIRSVIEGMR